MKCWEIHISEWCENVAGIAINKTVSAIKISEEGIMLLKLPVVCKNTNR